MLRRAIGSLLCLLYGFAVPMLAVLTWTLWSEHRTDFEKIDSMVRRMGQELGLSVDVRLTILGPIAAAAAFVIIWFLAGKRTRRATWMIVGLNAFAVAFVGLVIIGQK
ncbi:MAG: hypothetical protein ACR2PI_08140 [Hyphomicrobiaceae bacterium]